MAAHKSCRLCLSPLGSACIDLFDDKQRPHIVTDKLRQFVNLQVNSYEKLPFKVCQNCVVNLDFCIQFVDRIRRIDQLIRTEPTSDLSKFQAELTSHYPYLYGSLSGNQDKNPQTVPFNPGAFFGPTSDTSNSSSGSKKVRKILPKKKDEKMSSAAVKTHVQNGQYMIPVTVMTPCKNCNVMIKAASVQDIQNHACSSKEKSVNCVVDGCRKKFFTQYTLRYHLKFYHKMGQIKICSAKKDDNSQVVNQSSTTTATSPSSTSSSVNVDSAKYVCSWPNCTKAYRLKGYLDQHYRVHTGEKPFSCNNCSRGFSRILDLKKHQLLKVCTLNSK